MSKIRTALNIFRQSGGVALMKVAIERALKSCGVGVSLGSYKPIQIIRAAPTPADESIFERIYLENAWGSNETTSGPGSERAYTAGYQRALILFLQKEEIGSIFDAPCGDLNWFGDIIDKTGISYIGGDISPTAVNQAKHQRSDLDIRIFDIRCNKFPEVDAWHCRDCLFHLSFADIRSTLENFIASDIEYALITTNSALYLRNVDIETGGHRHLDLERSPINLPRPMRRLKDFTKGKHFPRYIGVWRRQQIKNALEASSWGSNS